MRSVGPRGIVRVYEVLLFTMTCYRFISSVSSDVIMSLSSDPDGDNSQLEPVNEDDADEVNFTTSEIGEFLGSKCRGECNDRLLNVHCDPVTKRCLCDRKYTVRLGATKGCAKPVRLGEQCFYAQTCTDLHATCIQVDHNAVCQCKAGFHSVTLSKPSKKIFCSEDIEVISTNVGSLLGVASGVAIFSALICFVLKLFVGLRPRHYATTHLSTPIIYAKDKGSRRPSMTSVQSASSGRSMSYSMMRFEKEREQKTEREARRKASSGLGAGAVTPTPPTPSPNPSNEKLLLENTIQPQVFSETRRTGSLRRPTTAMAMGPETSEARLGSCSPLNHLTIESHLLTERIPEESLET
ncbi:uncharacterized protein [Bemisia tabaci]|uniref:uncharacterized protein n=1 Tax=Bemisia tabaci TaxID=7038 RepID=UPI003B2802C3